MMESAEQTQQIAHDLTQSFVTELLRAATASKADTARAVERFVRSLLSDSVAARCLSTSELEAHGCSSGGDVTDSPADDEAKYLRARAFSFVRMVFSEGLDYVEMEEQRSLPPDEAQAHHAAIERARGIINSLTPEEYTARNAASHNITRKESSLAGGEEVQLGNSTPQVPKEVTFSDSEKLQQANELIAQLEDRVAALESSLALEKENSAEVLKLKQIEVESLEAKCGEFESEIESMKENIIVLKGDLAQSANDISALKASHKAETEQLKREANKLKHKYDLNAKEICNLQDKQEQYRRKIAAAEQESASKTSQYDALLQTLKDEKRKHHAETHTMEESLEVLSKTLREHDAVTKAKIFDVKTYYLKREEQILLDIEAAKPKLASVGIQSDQDPETIRTRMKVLSLESRLKSLTADSHNYAETLRNLQAENKSLTQSCDEIKAENVRIKDAARLVEDTHKYMTLKLQAANNEIEHVALESNQLRMLVEKSHYELLDSQKEVERLSSIIVQLREKIDSLQESRTLAREGNKRLKATLDTTKEEVLSLKQKRDELVSAVEGAGMSVEQLFEEYERLKQSQEMQEKEGSDNIETDRDQPATTLVIPADDKNAGITSPVGMKGIRTIRSKKKRSPSPKRKHLFSPLHRPSSAPGGVLPTNRLSMSGGKKKQDRCQECKGLIEGKGRTLPSTMKKSDLTARNKTAYMQALTPDALIQNYLDSGYPTINRSEDILFCSWNCAKEWNHHNSHAIIKQRTEDLIEIEEEKEKRKAVVKSNCM